MTVKYYIQLIFFMGLFSQLVTSAQQLNQLQKANLVLINGKIFTSDTSKLYVNGLAIKGNKIIATGTDEQMKKYYSKSSRIINLMGKTVIPGFNDAHNHLAWLINDSFSFKTEFSVPGITKSQLLDSLSQIAKISRPGRWIHGTIGLNVFNDTSIRKRLLDSIFPNNPVALVIMWGHGMIVNSMALQKCKIRDGDADPLGGIVERYSGTTVNNGVLYEYAQYPFWEMLNITQPENIIKSLRSYGSEAVGYGITTVQNMSSSLQANSARYLFKKADLPLRVRVINMPATTNAGRDLTQFNGKYFKLTNLNYFSGIKYVIDGTSIEQMALMTKPYNNRPNWYGKLNFPVDTIKQILKESLLNKTQLMLHIVGDSSTALVLKLMKEMAPDETWRNKRVRLEHGVAILTQSMIKNVKDLGVVIVHTPQYGFKSPLKSWINECIHIAIGPDGVNNPYLNLLLVTTKQRDTRENLSREDAVISYTNGAAYAEFAEQNKGTLTVGKLADLAVLSQDIFSVPDSLLPDTKSVLTIIDGKIVFKKN